MTRLAYVAAIWSSVDPGYCVRTVKSIQRRIVTFIYC